MHLILRRPTAAFFLAATTALAFAAAASAQPVDAGQLQKRFDREFAPAATPSTPAVPDFAPPASPDASGSMVSFQLTGVQIEGATAYKQRDLQPLYAKYLNKQVSLSDVQAIAEAITVKYRRDGYVLSRAVVPQQESANGVVRIHVIEGYLSNVTFEGQIKGRRSLLDGYATNLKESRPLNVADLERYLLLIDDLPGVTVKSVVRPGAQSGASELVVTLQHKTYEGSLTLDNRGSKFYGPYQAEVAVAENSALGLYERTQARALVTAIEPDELRYFDINHEQQLNSEGTRIEGYGAYTFSSPGSNLEPLDIESESVAFNLTLSHPVIRARSHNLKTRLTLTARNVDTDTFVGSPAETQLYNDRVRAVRFGNTLDFTDKLRGVNLIDLEMSQGVGATGDGSEKEDTDISRPGADGEFSKLNLQVQRLQPIYGNWSAFVSGAAQYSFKPLFASEEFAVGGQDYGRAYDTAEITGDHGVAAKAELRYGAMTPYRWLKSYQLYTFYDVGAVWNIDGFAKGQDPRDTLSSVGLGARLNLTDWLSGYAEVDLPISRDVSSEGDKDPRGFVSLTARF